MKHSLFLLVALLAFAGCQDKKAEPAPKPCPAVEENPFRFIIVDQAGSNQLSSADSLANHRLYYRENGVPNIIDLGFKSGSRGFYGISGALPLISVGGKPDFYFLERDSVTDTLTVRVFRAPPGEECYQLVYGAVTFNGVAAVYDTTASPPVFVLTE